MGIKLARRRRVDDDDDMAATRNGMFHIDFCSRRYVAMALLTMTIRKTISYENGGVLGQIV